VGAKGGYALRRHPSEIHLSEIIRLVDGPLAPFGDAEQLRALIDKDPAHRALYKVFLEVRDAAANILEEYHPDRYCQPAAGRDEARKTPGKKKERGHRAFCRWWFAGQGAKTSPDLQRTGAAAGPPAENKPQGKRI